MSGGKISWEDAPPHISRHPQRIRRVADLTVRDYMLITRMLSVLAVFGVLRHMRSLPELIQALDPGERSAGGSRPAHRQVQICDAILRRLYGKDYCLRRSVILFHVLRRAGIPVRFVMGVVVRENDSLFGHAWVEINGEPLAEAVDPRESYTVTYSYPPSSQ